MTYQNEPNTNRRRDVSGDANYTHWIIGGAVAFAIVIAAAAFLSTGNYPDQPQTTTTTSAPSHSTIGSETAPQLRPPNKSVAFRNVNAIAM